MDAAATPDSLDASLVRLRPFAAGDAPAVQRFCGDARIAANRQRSPLWCGRSGAGCLV